MLITHNCIDLDFNKKEIYRYLGYKNHETSSCDDLIDECIDMVKNALECKACYEIYPIFQKDEFELDLGFDTIHSKDLSKNLKYCDNIILFAATIGMQTDRLITKYSSISPSKSVVLQAVGAAAIEAWCDILCDELKKLDIAKGKSFMPRFSPGYGDLSLQVQSSIFEALNCRKLIGVTLTESLMMLPTKSVSAIVGICNKP